MVPQMRKVSLYEDNCLEKVISQGHSKGVHPTSLLHGFLHIAAHTVAGRGASVGSGSFSCVNKTCTVLHGCPPWHVFFKGYGLPQEREGHQPECPAPSTGPAFQKPLLRRPGRPPGTLKSVAHVNKSAPVPPFPPRDADVRYRGHSDFLKLSTSCPGQALSAEAAVLNVQFCRLILSRSSLVSYLCSLQ